jgi:hypothetical protein
MQFHTVYLQDVRDSPLLLIRCRVSIGRCGISRHFSPGHAASPESVSPDKIFFYFFGPGAHREMHLPRETPLLLIRCRVSIGRCRISRHFSPGDAASPESVSPNKIFFYFFGPGAHREMHLPRETPLLLIRCRVSIGRCRISRHFSPGDAASPESASPDQIFFFFFLGRVHLGNEGEGEDTHRRHLLMRVRA